ncbi:lysyl-tRNA synthetase, class II [Fusarium oxysporum f. sp. raphani 54005]|uniref:Lysyl-tRNA synthetase n=2 Tax=Fusarium oxysporum f. sp. raphani TaxID=96318 RepID=X0DNG3_FUSOX|nr:lysyl-tRNA synthetase, class II [Fusarium oxysporum f. sp. raphani 54005]KAJ4058679.1 mitochondrial lysine-tRNA synthetase [Fusarium oxysporum]KAJ4060064.1 mitochondrial lysine-tRNA synthetase [Fusarium oxysporum]KAJ4063239.1 mitochondrial lysine-tRNA synthetase [Fusarium oxysporum]KAJ4104981.1 mitochondrial lysine-tRNA synthetase [Fusarium oxysporum]
MMSVRYLRQASRPLIQSISQTTSARCSHALSCGNSSRTLWGSQSVAYGRSLATSAARSQDGLEGYSSFKQQRRTELLAEKESEDPLFEETHPRLIHHAERKTVPEFHEAFRDALDDSKYISVCGRVRSKRVVGKNLIFLDIVNEFERLQVMLNRSKCMVEEEARSLKFGMLRNLIEVGDHISVVGIPVRTKAGELTMEAKTLPELLSPTMEQIPEKLTDPKTRMQERHVDMLVNRQAIDVLRLRAEITKHMREYFHSRKFLEFQTPILAENAGGAVARPFVTRATEFKDKDLALRIAPELWLKRLVIGGVDKVFEIGPSFRNEGVDATHNPEFTMCEFYSAYSNLEDLINQTEEILCSLAQHSQDLISTQLTSLPSIDMKQFVRPFKRVEFVPALQEALGLRLPKLSSPDALPELLAILRLAGIKVPGEVPTSLAKLLDRLAAVYLEPMSFTEPILIMNHPACMSPLAKSFLCPQTYQLVSARAELFIGGRELANMYEEENDPEEQKRKLLDHRNLVNKDDGSIAIEHNEASEGEAAVEEALDEPFEDEDGDAAPLDQSYVKALDYGLPPTGGWGCGVERMVMLFSGANRISDCLSFGTIRNVVGLSAAEENKTSSEEDKKLEEDKQASPESS